MWQYAYVSHAELKSYVLTYQGAKRLVAETSRGELTKGPNVRKPSEQFVFSSILLWLFANFEFSAESADCNCFKIDDISANINAVFAHKILSTDYFDV